MKSQIENTVAPSICRTETGALNIGCYERQARQLRAQTIHRWLDAGLRLLARAVRYGAACARRAAARRELGALDQHALKDLGLGPGDLPAIVSGDFLADPTRRQRRNTRSGWSTLKISTYHHDKERPMPLVRISLMKGRQPNFGKQVGDVVYRAMVKTMNVPPQDHFQIITEHDDDSLIYDPLYLDIPRTHGVVFIQITLNEGRSVEVKKSFYQAVAEDLNKALGVRTEDVFINLVEVKKENWSFGNGIAQYA